MLFLLVAATVSLVPFAPVVTDHADVVEINYCYDGEANLVLSQVIFWRWNPKQNAYRVFAWRLLKTASQVPWRSSERDGYVTVWIDGETMRRVTTSAVRYTWSQYDPELHDRRFLPPRHRRGLSRHRTASR